MRTWQGVKVQNRVGTHRGRERETHTVKGSCLFFKLLNIKDWNQVPFIKGSCSNTNLSCLNHELQQTHHRAPLFVTAVEKLTISYWYLLPFLCYINSYNVWCLFYWLPAGKKKTGWRLAVFCQRGDMVERDTCETLAHCQYPSVYLAAKMVVVMENKRSRQRILKMNE